MKIKALSLSLILVSFFSLMFVTACEAPVEEKSANDDSSSGGDDDGGGGSTPVGTVVVTQAYGKLFATSATHDADLWTDGSTEVDQLDTDPICTTEATLLGLTGIFKVVGNVSGRTKASNWVLKNSAQYRRVDGTIIGTTNASGYFDFPLTAAISATPVSVWSGLDASYNNDFSFHCSNLSWNGAGNSTYGELQYTDSRAVSSSFTGCSDVKNVLCAEMIPRTTTVPAQAAYRRIFPTTVAMPAATGFINDNSIPRFDGQCQADADSKGISNDGYTIYKALVVTNTTNGAITRRMACLTDQCGNGAGEAVGWILEPNTQYRREDGTTVIGSTNANSIFEFPLTNSFTGVSEQYWTGQNPGWATQTNSSTINCAFYQTKNADGTTSNIGVGDAVNSDSISGGTAFCDQSRKILCVEQKRTQTVWVDYPGYN